MGSRSDRHSCNARGDLFQQLQPFCAQAVLEHEKAGGIAARPRQAGDEFRLPSR